ncbi:MAG TPA: ubiquinol-cytochrome c reductase iron-sulfur subunit [Candidatus Obscuribacterales bacterium]
MVDWKKVFVSRQEFLKLVAFVCSAVIALIVAIPSVCFMMYFLFVPQNPTWVALGSLDDFKEGETVPVAFKSPYALPWDRISSKRTAWVRRLSAESFIAFAINCTHLGCPVRWEQGADLFLCPCHGGVFYADGDVAGGPPPRPLHRYAVRVNKGQVEIAFRPVLTEA